MPLGDGRDFLFYIVKRIRGSRQTHTPVHTHSPNVPPLRQDTRQDETKTNKDVEEGIKQRVT